MEVKDDSVKKMSFFRYVKVHIRWLFAVLFCGVIMSVVMVLNQIPAEEVWYGILLCISLWLCIALYDYLHYRKQYQKLLELESSVTYCLEGMPESREPVELQYQKLLQKLMGDKQQLEQQTFQRERDLVEYYTMWVHQIKTPIAALKLLLEEKNENGIECREEQQELFRIEQYVEMALQYMRLGSESTDFVFRSLKLDDIIREVVRKYARTFIRKKISLNYEGVDRTVLTDEKWLSFVIEQLLSNALKYTQKGSISIYMEDNRLVIADTGIGIRAEDLPRVCEMGYTGYNGHADKRSTGIGLYLCNRTLNKLGHGFSITSEEGCGTRVEICFEEN